LKALHGCPTYAPQAVKETDDDDDDDNDSLSPGSDKNCANKSVNTKFI
jgi:hypothetical protein